ncbi:MAG: septum formation inhibitor Maf [Deltaproteobacteria bacterium]|nr:septum formation inhibitor Maf [Deltaproteobacteria bacterium]
MNIRWMVLTILILAGLPAAVAQTDKLPQFGTHSRDQFQDYWYNHGAEISRFSLQQMRYGEIHEGDAVLVFVTEKMNPVTQIKADHPGSQEIAILKLNAVRKFFTGIYPYSIMTSIFAPVDVQKYPLPLKISSSTQEWCGHVYTQMNLNENGYRVRMHSYFEGEGDRDLEVQKVIAEDALWTLIRLAPASLPRGEFFMIPGTVYTRLAHRPVAAQRAISNLSPSDEKSLEGNPLVIYEINFPDEQRTLGIYFERNFPYRIQKWHETYRGLIDQKAKILTTRAVRTHTIMDPYWRHHTNKDRRRLEALGLSAREMGGN